ncbi:hypothetical protein [Streptomyces sp. NPDC055080]
MTETGRTIRGELSTAALLQHSAELRSALEHAVRMLTCTTGHTTADSPPHAERLKCTAQDMTALLLRIAPARPAASRR